jgi:hypothetical protein
MPYYITKNHPDCKSGWATVNGDYELKGCHKTKAKAIAQMVAISQAEDVEPGGTHPRDTKREAVKKTAKPVAKPVVKVKEVTDVLYQQVEGDEKALVDAMLGVVEQFGKFQSEGSMINAGYDSAETNPNLAIGVKCGNCVFHIGEGPDIQCSAVEQEIEEDGACRFAMIPPGLVNAREVAKRKREAATYSPPQGVRNAAKRAQKWIAEGKAGSGFTDVGRRRASQLANGESVSPATVKRMRSYFARHEVDRKANGFFAGEKNFPTPGRVAWDAWGGDAGKSWVNGLKMDGDE